MARRSLLPLVLLASLAARPLSAAANIVIVNTDPAGTGLSDPTPVAPVGGNAGTTLGDQRLKVFQQAAAIWGGLINSNVTIRVSASFAPLQCSATTGVLGSTYANTVYSDFKGTPMAGTWYAKALAAKFAGADQDPNTFDMTAQFNSSLGQTGCLTGTSFYLGFDNQHGNNINFLTVALHEFAHGLGFFSGVDSTGAFLGATSSQPTPLPTIFDRFIYDDTLGQTWDKLTSAQRATSVVNTGNLTWSGSAANAFAAGYLGKRRRLLVTAPTPAAGAYSVGTASFGPALSNPGITGQIVAATDASDLVGPSTTDGCSAFTNASEIAGKIALVDRGGGVAPNTCPFVLKVKNAQNAGAIGVVIADNTVEGIFGMSGTDATITIPSVLVSMSDGAKLRANLPASANLGLDATLLAGADAAGRLQLYAPNPWESGSSISHWDATASPNLLMEPNINSDLPIGVDATLPVFNDIGWLAGTSGPTTTYLLPSSAHAPGIGAFYTTDLTIANRGTTDANITLQFLGHDQDGTAGPKQNRALAANKAVTYADILASLFGVSASDYGAILITADSASLKIVSQTSTPASNGVGTFGQSVPAQGANDFVTPGTPKSLVGLREDTAFRTNLVLANATTSSVTVNLTLLAGDGSTIGTTARTLSPLGMTQVGHVVTALGAPFGTTNAVLVVSTTTTGAQVGTYAAVIDNGTSDPRTILP
ncbi:MAG TPA: PA domain-containing protein [Thermoanaerobaculia bacterium]|nr:PA domain-containing protein [Thermoanaerobaculia bacterium]